MPSPGPRLTQGGILLCCLFSMFLIIKKASPPLFARGRLKRVSARAKGTTTVINKQEIQRQRTAGKKTTKL